MKGTVEGLFAWSTDKGYGMPECCFVSACSSFSLHSLLCISPFSLPFLFLTLESYSLVPFLFACLLRFISLRNSWVGTVLVIVWFLVAYLFAFFEEEKLIEAYGDEYQEYKRKVKWRLIPYLF